MYLVIGIVLAFIVSFWKDNRSLWNPVLFLLSLISSYFYLSYLFSKELGEKLVASSQFLFVTNDYYVFRTSTYARKLGMKGDGLGCRTDGYYIPSAVIREYVALCVKLKWLFIFFYALLFIALLLSYKGILWEKETLLNFLRRVFMIEIVKKSRLKSLITEEKMK